MTSFVGVPWDERVNSCMRWDRKKCPVDKPEHEGKMSDRLACTQ